MSVLNDLKTVKVKNLMLKGCNYERMLDQNDARCLTYQILVEKYEKDTKQQNLSGTPDQRQTLMHE